MTEPTRLFLGLKKFLSEHIFNINGNVNVVNLPETQKVEIVNHQLQQESIVVSNVKELTEPLSVSISSVYRAIKELPTPENNDILIALERLIIAINEKDIPQVDLTGILKKLDETTSISVNLKLE